MLFLRFLVLCFCVGWSGSVPFRFVDRDEQQFIDHLLLDADNVEKNRPKQHHIDEFDELEKEKLSQVNQKSFPKAKSTQNRDQFQLIKKAAAAVVKRLSMPSPPKTDSLVEKAVQFVFKNSFPVEYAKIRSAIKEEIEKMILSSGNHEELVSKPKVSGPRVEKILIALEDILSELAVELNLTTPQVKLLVNSTVNVLSEHFGLKFWQIHELHERVTSHVRAKLKYEDWDNKDARLRRLEENIEKEINYLKLTDKQAKRLEVFMVRREAIKEGLSKEERLRMLKRVIADIKDDFKAEKIEQEAPPPKLSSVNVINIKNVIRQKALEMQLTKKELKILGIAIITAIEKLTLHTSPTPTPSIQKSRPTKVTPTEKKELEEELERTKSPERSTSTDHPDHLITHSSAKPPTMEPDKDNSEKKRETEDDLVSMLAQDEANLEEEEFRPKQKKTLKDSKSSLLHDDISNQHDELQLELVEKQHSGIASSLRVPRVTEPATRTEKKSTAEYKPTQLNTRKAGEDKPTKKLAPSIHATENARKKLEEDLLEGATVTKPTENHLTTLTKKHKATAEIVETETRKKPEIIKQTVPTTNDSELEEDLLEDRTTKPTTFHTVTPHKTTTGQIELTPKTKEFKKRKPTKKLTHPTQTTTNEDKDLEGDLLENHAVEVKHKTTQKPIKTEGEKSTVKLMHSETPTKDVDKELEEDLLGDRMTAPTDSHANTVTQHKTEELLVKATQKSIITEQEKSTEKVMPPETPTKDVDKELEEDLLEDRITKPSLKTFKKHSPSDLEGELQGAGDDKVYSRRHRVQLMDNEAELEDFALKKSGKKEDTSLEEDLRQVEHSPKKSLEDELTAIISQKEAKEEVDAHLLEDELKDLSDG